MKKVFLIHGFEGRPNGAWRGWLMAELERKGIYAGSLVMPNPNEPILKDWIKEIARHIDTKKDQVYLVGHSLGVTAILRYLESSHSGLPLRGAVLVSGPVQKTKNKKIVNFLQKPFDFKKIKTNVKKVFVIHGDNDPYVPLINAEIISRELKGELIVIKNGQHLNGSSGWGTLPQCLEALNGLIK